MRNVANNTGTEALQHEHSSEMLRWNITKRAKTGFLKITATLKPSVHHDLTTNVTILTPIKRINDSGCVMFLGCYIVQCNIYISIHLLWLQRHTPYFTRASEVHGVHSVQEEAVLAVSPGNKRTRIGFVWLFTHMMDCDEATLIVWEERRWPGVLHCWAVLWWMISPHFSLALSQMLDNPGELRRSPLDCLTGRPQPRLCCSLCTLSTEI